MFLQLHLPPSIRAQHLIQKIDANGYVLVSVSHSLLHSDGRAEQDGFGQIIARTVLMQISYCMFHSRIAKHYRSATLT
jgi:hypothetical protein